MRRCWSTPGPRACKVSVVLWVWIFGGLAVAGLVTLVVYGVGLAHRVAAVRHEVEVTLGRLDDARALAAQLSLPGRD